MNEPPIPFIAYILITVTAGTLAYATITAESEDKPEENNEGSQTENNEGSVKENNEGSQEENGVKDSQQPSDFSENNNEEQQNEVPVVEAEAVQENDSDKVGGKKEKEE